MHCAFVQRDPSSLVFFEQLQLHTRIRVGRAKPCLLHWQFNVHHTHLINTHSAACRQPVLQQLERGRDVAGRRARAQQQRRRLATGTRRRSSRRGTSRSRCQSLRLLGFASHAEFGIRVTQTHHVTEITALGVLTRIDRRWGCSCVYAALRSTQLVMVHTSHNNPKDSRPRTIAVADLHVFPGHAVIGLCHG